MPQITRPEPLAVGRFGAEHTSGQDRLCKNPISCQASLTIDTLSHQLAVVASSPYRCGGSATFRTWLAIKCGIAHL